MLNDAKMRNNGDGTVTFEFQMNADEYTEIAVLKKMMSDYDKSIGILRRAYCTAMLHDCELCGASTKTTAYEHDSECGIVGPVYYCQECAKKMSGLRKI